MNTRESQYSKNNSFPAKKITTLIWMENFSRELLFKNKLIYKIEMKLLQKDKSSFV